MASSSNVATQHNVPNEKKPMWLLNIGILLLKKKSNNKNQSISTMNWLKIMPFQPNEFFLSRPPFSVRD